MLFSRSARIEDESKLSETLVPEPNSRKSRNRTKKRGRSSSKPKIVSRVFSEDYEKLKTRILDPRGLTVRYWNKIFFVACLVSVFVDPLFHFLQLVDSNNFCIHIKFSNEFTLTIIRSVADLFYVAQIYIRFNTAYVAPSPRVLGRGELVIDPYKIAKKYLCGGFWIDLIAALPLPQVLSWLIIPNISGQRMENNKTILWVIVLFFQYLPRLYLISPLTSEILELAGVVTKTALAGTAYNLVLFLLAGEIVGSCYYLLSIQRQAACWRSVCLMEDPSCEGSFFDCKSVNDNNRLAWFQSSNVTNQCVPSSSYWEFGIYTSGVNFEVTSAAFSNRYFFSVWFGMQNVVCLGQNLVTSPYVNENIFTIMIGILGLFLIAMAIGNMDRYVRSTGVRLEEWRVKKTDIEQWMRRRQLPQELKDAVRRYHQYKWVATQGVDEECLLKGLPVDLRRDIKRHLCYDLVRRVPLFDQMDERMLNAICERLKPALVTQGTCPVREGDPVNGMLFIIRGNLDSYKARDDGFFTSCRIEPGDFFGEELLTWALDSRPSPVLPSSTRTIKAISEVEAFALTPDDLKFVALQFRQLHSKQLRHKFRFSSHQWRTWAACVIQTAWRRYLRRRKNEVKARESFTTADDASLDSGSCASFRKMENIIAAWRSTCSTASPRKPAEPDFCEYPNY